MKSLYALLHIGPLGFKQTELQFVEELPEDADKAYYTHGEGQCLIFKLDKYDMSTNFNKAFKQGLVTQELIGVLHPVKFIEKRYLKKGRLIGQSYAYPPRPHEYVFIDGGGCEILYKVSKDKIEEHNLDWIEIELEKYMELKNDNQDKARTK